MEEDKFCVVCGKQIEKSWVAGEVQDKEVLFCTNCAIEILMKKQWILEEENQALKDRWNKLKQYINTRLSDYRFEGHIVSPETEELSVIINKIQELEKDFN